MNKVICAGLVIFVTAIYIELWSFRSKKILLFESSLLVLYEEGAINPRTDIEEKLGGKRNNSHLESVFSNSGNPHPLVAA